MKDKIVIKKVVSLTLAFSFLIMSVTGVMLYIVPKGKVAYWANWEMFGLTKTQYGDIHITSMFLFLVITIWHIYYNWKPLVNYLKDSTKKITFFKKEFLIALVVNTLFVVGTLIGVEPFKLALSINDDIKSYWEKEYGSPPYGHAEESSLSSFSRYLRVDVKDAIKLLEAKNIKIENSTQTLLEISKKNGVSPKTISDIIKPKQGITTKGISSLGRKTLGELAKMNKINLQKSIQFLEKKGFRATEQTKMREMANRLDKTPIELYEKLKVLQ